MYVAHAWSAALLRLTRIRLIVCLLAVVLPAAYGQQHNAHRHKPADPMVEDVTLTVAQAQLRGIIQGGRLDELQRADFSDRRRDIASIYRKSNYSPVWLRDGRPTSQALQLITILQD